MSVLEVDGNTRAQVIAVTA